jgi:hypothetical protein
LIVLFYFIGTLFCYGQTKTGKTYTMMGRQDSFQYRGVIPRAISDIFQPQLQSEIYISKFIMIKLQSASASEDSIHGWELATMEDSNER